MAKVTSLLNMSQAANQTQLALIDLGMDSREGTRMWHVTFVALRQAHRRLRINRKIILLCRIRFLYEYEYWEASPGEIVLSTPRSRPC
eukprot:scaffold190754_cov32-Prasinocladus_malaysianus.AAC.1